MKRKIIASFWVAALVLLFAGSACAQTVKGVVERITVTLKLPDGTSKTFEVKGTVNLVNVDEGDTVEIRVKNNEITHIEVTEEEADEDGD